MKSSNTTTNNNENENENNYEDDVPSDDSSSACCLADIGFMLDGAQPTKKEQLVFYPSHNNANDNDDKPSTPPFGINVTIEAVDDEPGAVQSGHYLWPAAPALAQHLVDTYYYDPSPPAEGDDDNVLPPAATASSRLSSSKTEIMSVELGAGCGLASLVALQLFDNIKCMAVTDHDPGTLHRARENHESTMAMVEENNNDGRRRKQGCLKDVPLFFENLSWGDDDSAVALLRKVTSTIHRPDDDKNNEEGVFNLILGSDVIYCREVVRPLFRTISRLLCKTTTSIPVAIMIMAQSFAYDDETEEEIDDSCDCFGLCREIVMCDLENGGVRVQTFRFRE